MRDRTVFVVAIVATITAILSTIGSAVAMSVTQVSKTIETTMVLISCGLTLLAALAWMLLTTRHEITDSEHYRRWRHD